MSRVFAAELTWTGERFERDVRLEVDAEGRIVRVGAFSSRVDVALEGRALLPGFVNAHSHAFQRGLRGRGETFPVEGGSFWTWREAMYSLVEDLDAATFAQITERAFLEMRRAGITTVGEFHYLHHSPAGDDWAFDEIVLRAARAAGIRLVLLNAYYRTGGIDAELEGGQRRFSTTDPDSYWETMDRLARILEPGRESLGAVVHSLRAATPDEAASIHSEARRRHLVTHIHLEEQREEIEMCRRAYGTTPMGTLLERLDDLRGLTAVHCTHTHPDEALAFLERGGGVVVCPLTEANLGDGIPHPAVLSNPGATALGTDSNARISMLEEMRWLEYAQRLRTETRGALRAADGRVAPRLLAAATSGGARRLGVETGSLSTGQWADMMALDLSHPALADSDDETLLPSWIFGGSDDAIVGTWVGGRS